MNGVESTEEKIQFFYYPDLKIAKITNNVGPLQGGTASMLSGVAFTHPNVCKPRVKYGAIEIIPEIVQGFFKVISPHVAVPGAVTLFPSGNG